MKRGDVMDFDEPSSACSVSGGEIEAARLANKTPGLTQNGLAFLTDQLSIPFTPPMQSREQPTFVRFGDVIVVVGQQHWPRRGGIAIADAINFSLSGHCENSVQTSSVP
jgi:hypothetical protein